MLTILKSILSSFLHTNYVNFNFLTAQVVGTGLGRFFLKLVGRLDRIQLPSKRLKKRTEGSFKSRLSGYGSKSS